MAYSDDELEAIYDRTSGSCHLYEKKLAFKNYGRFGARGAWEVEHSNPRCNGGTDRACNRYAACISCNRSTRARSTRSARSQRRAARMSRDKRRAAKVDNAIGGALLGGAVGSAFGPAGAWIGAAIGAHLGHKRNPDRDE